MGKASRSEAISPHSETLYRLPGLSPDHLFANPENRWMKQSENPDKEAFPRSAQKTYWVRSLVPMLTKSRCGKSWSIKSPADGVSIIAPDRDRPSVGYVGVCQFAGDSDKHFPGSQDFGQVRNHWDQQLNLKKSASRKMARR